MLPHVNAKDRHLTPDDGILVLGGDDAQALGVLDQPSPATSLQTQQGLLEGLLESLEAAPGLGDLGNQGRGAVGLGVWGAGGAQVLPEEGVVDVAASVELDS